MSHLIAAIRDVTVAECMRRVRECHGYLVAAGQQAVALMHTKKKTTGWGTETKRVAVRLGAPRPRDIGADLEEHNLVEVINQTATVERLIDVLEWVQTAESTLADFTQVRVCHPSTSCGTGEEWENDLVLVNKDGVTARFEISDIVSSEDSNRKLPKELASLRVADKSDETANTRLFVVVSQEFSDFVRKQRHSQGRNGIALVENKTAGKTHVFECYRSIAAHEPHP